MGIQNLIASSINFINNVLVPFIFALAFAFFLVRVFQFFFVKGTDPKARVEGRNFIIGSIIALAVMVSVWGLVNLVAGTFRLDRNQPRLPIFNAGGGSSGGFLGGSGNDERIPAGTSDSAIPAGSAQTSPSTSGGDNCFINNDGENICL
ncbi:MAG: hypothetical protein AB202_00050 [Parcubacteria bacterium C7867-007]|nr:MAG: hypothetical protein AB202_00050 [Parcubacteria bacterium C7867-007]